MLGKNKRRPDPSSPMDLSYMKRVEFYLYLLSAWPYDELYDTYKKRPKELPLRNKKIIFLMWICITASGVLYLKANVRKLSFFELGHSYITVFMSFIAVQRLLVPSFKSYHQTVGDFVLKLHLFHHKDKSEYAMKVYEQVHKISTLFSFCLFTQMYVGGSLFTVIPVYNNIKSGVFTASSHNVENGTRYEHAVYEQVHKISTLFSFCLFTQMYVGGSLFTVIPVYNNIKSGVFTASSHNVENGTRYEHAVYHFYIFDYNNFGYTVTFITNCLIVFDCSIILCAYDSLMTLIVFNVWGHLKILKYNLENFPRPEAEGDIHSVNSIMYTEDERQKVLAMLKENIVYHTMITQFMSRASDVFGPIMCFYYLFDQVSGCILLLELSAMNMEAIASYGVLTVILLQQLVQISVIFEMIGSKSETIKNAVYDLPWECMDVKSRKMVLFFLYNSQTPITLKAMGMVSVGVQTMASILKTSVSYFVMLRAVAEN